MTAKTHVPATNEVFDKLVEHLGTPQPVWLDRIEVVRIPGKKDTIVLHSKYTYLVGAYKDLRRLWRDGWMGYKVAILHKGKNALL